MISLDIREKKLDKKTKTFVQTTEIKIFKTLDQAKPLIRSIVSKMNEAKKKKVAPDIEIVGVTYELDSEKKGLIELGALNSEE